MASISEITHNVQLWLRGENAYQFAKFDTIYGDELRNRRDFIVSSEIPNKWHRNIVLRSGEAHFLADQQVLKVCAAARAVIVYSDCLAGNNRYDSSENTFAILNDHFTDIDERKLPRETFLFEPFDAVFSGLSEQELFLRSADIAVVGLSYTESRVGKYILPKAGLPSGELE